MPDQTVASRFGVGICRGAVFFALMTAPLGVHLAMATQRGLFWAGVLVVSDATLLGWVALSFVHLRSLRWVGCALVLALTAAVWRFSPDGIIASAAIPHAIAYLSILAVFAASLAPGRKPIVTIFAERSRGPLSPEISRYTRRVTWAWCVFCVGQLLGSLALLLFAPVQVWSTFVNICNFPLLAVMFGGEFAWRQWRHGRWPRERLTDGLRMVRQAASHDTV